ncbi:MAG: YerC/YecD family TrpR-related protein [Patescibacteria group bacterium]
MSKFNMRKLDSNSKMKYLDLLWTSIAQLETRDEVKQFLKDILSESEAIMLARRIEIAKRLLEGESYDNIANKLGVGKDTIGRVQEWLTSGFGGYEKAIGGFDKALEKRFKNPKNINKPEPYSFDWLKRKYPLHFLLFNLIDSGKGSKSKTKK